MFKSEKLIPMSVADLAPVAQELAGHFKERNYQVECLQLPGGEWEVGITRGGAFKAAVGLKSAMKIQIEAYPGGTMVRAGTGIFGKQAIPTTITLLVAWPVILTQVWGLIREANLDGEAVSVVEMSLKRQQRAGGAADGQGFAAGGLRPQPDDGAGLASASGAAGGREARQKVTTPPSFCTGCGGELGDSARFCPLCGQAR